LGVDKDMLLPITKYDEKKVDYIFFIQVLEFNKLLSTGSSDVETVKPVPSNTVEVRDYSCC
jgi:hypothetical protein